MSGNHKIPCAILVVGLISSGCLVNSHNDIKRSGTYISDTTLGEIEPGKTPSSWVLATLGTPTEKTSVDANHEVWKYTYTETRDSNGAVFLLFAGHDHKVSEGKVFVEIKDGVVTKCWRA